MAEPSPRPNREFFVVGVTHIDLAWKRGSAEMTEMLEILAIRLLDALESEPDFRYMIEQAAHYRTLAKTRPDLVERLKRYVQEGRLEMVGGMASTLETNLPNGESFVRNQAIGRKWVRENFGVEIRTGWLFDTFGLHAQVPQILRQFGITNLMANRFGGATFHDIFLARGLDGSEILLVGRESYSAFIRRENTLRVFYHDWDGIDRLFREADDLPGTGPILLIPYVENEYLLSLRPLRIVEERNAARSHESYRMATPGDYFTALEKTGREWPVIYGDLNPEFTGCFSLRPTIRLRNRKAETLLLEAEKWATLHQLPGWEDEIEEAWWNMAFLQFHDVFTGSHPTAVYREVMEMFDAVEQAASRIRNRALESVLPEFPAATHGVTVLATNGLPWERTDVVTLPLPETVSGITRVIDSEGDPVPFAERDGELRFCAILPAVGTAPYFIESVPSIRDEPAERPHESVTAAVIANEYILLEVDSTIGVRRLIWKPTGCVLMENVGDLLVAQRDDGTFQIEQPNGAEVAAAAGTMCLLPTIASPLGQTLWLTGAFPRLPWAGPENVLTWEIEFFVAVGKPRLDLKLRLNWKGEGSRLRLKLPTTIDSSEGIFEIPFGTVRRKPYGIRGNARGEWPAHRFVAIEDGAHGIALANTGVGGVEVGGGTLWTTLLRAPKAEGVGMNPDGTSSQHGEHEFDFALIPYAGSWSEAGVVNLAQELNNPVQTVMRPGRATTLSPASHLSIDRDNVVLSSVKATEDGSGEWIVRVYETLGFDGEFTLTVANIESAWESDLREQRFASIAVLNNGITVPIKPYEIKTLRIARRR